MSQSPVIPYTKEYRALQYMFGAQDYLRFFHPAYISSTQGPGGTLDPLGGKQGQILDAGGLPIQMGSRLIDAVTIPVGTYFFGFPMASISSVNIQLLATFSTGTATFSAFSTFQDHQTSSQAFTGGGALVTATPLTPALATPKGEQWAILQLVVTVATFNPTWTRAEFNGLRI